MALGGGIWQVQNKVLPGTYINITSAARAGDSPTERGVVAAPFMLSWGSEETVFAVTAEEYKNKCRSIFGYDADSDKMLALRELFCNATTVYCYRLGTGTKAANDYATAKYAGVRGNDITIKIASDVDNANYYRVGTYLDGVCVDEQLIKEVSALTANDFVTFKTGFTLQAVAGAPLTGGADCQSYTGQHYQAFLDAIESYTYNVLCCPVRAIGAADSTSLATIALFVNFIKRMRDEIGAKCQLCAIRPVADHEGVIGVWNTATYNGETSDALVYWVAGAQASAPTNRSLTNCAYNGNLTVNTAYTQAALEQALKAGKFILHNVNGTVRVLSDINTLVTFTDDKGEIFRDNQTVRVCDSLANKIAQMFAERYMGTVQNDESGREALWNDVVKLIQSMTSERLISAFDPGCISVSAGDKKGSVQISVAGLRLIGSMEQLYMRIVVM